MLKFLISVSALVAGLFAAVFAGAEYQWFGTIPSYTVEIIFFLGVTTATIFYFLIRQLQSPSFTQSYLLSIVLKMIGYGAFILMIIFKDKSGAFANALLFIVAYVLFTALEVSFLFKRINR